MQKMSKIANIDTRQMQAPTKTLNMVLAINKHIKVANYEVHELPKQL